VLKCKIYPRCYVNVTYWSVDNWNGIGRNLFTFLFICAWNQHGTYMISVSNHDSLDWL